VVAHQAAAAVQSHDEGELGAAMAHARYEVLPLEGIVDDVVAHVPRSVKVTVTASPAKGLDRTVEVAEQLAARGYAVVPHLSARLVRDKAHLQEVLRRLHAAEIREVFVIAGDAREPAGEFPGAADLLAAMNKLGGEPFAEVGIAGYPESHHLISDAITIEAMFQKEPMATYIVSQICFDPEVTAGWVRAVRERGTLLPIWIGVPGAVDNRRLMRTSLRIGLGESARFLRSHGGWVRRLLRRRFYSPDRLLARLAPLFSDPAARIAGIHVYTFNELERTERWRRRLS
jgi:methylenetetrahydrofolate reductase (NADPH)